MPDNELIIRINGNVKGYKDALKAATKETEALQDELNKIAKAGAVLFTAMAASVVLSTARFAEFDHGLRGVKTLLDESSFSTKTLDQGFQDLSKGALASLSNFPLALESINKSLFDIISAGIPAANAIDVLGSTSKLAVAGITESAIATDGVTTAMNAYGLSAEAAELVAAKLFTTQKFGKTTVRELSSFMGEAIASANAYGISLDELLASTAAATTGGIKTSQAFTSLTAVMANVAKPTAEAEAESERLGISFNSTALRTKGLKGFLDDLTKAQNFNKQSIEKLFGSTEAQKLIFSLTGDQAEKFKETLDALSDSEQSLSTFQKAYEEQSKSLKNQLVILKNNADVLSIIMGSNMAPAVETLTGLFTDFLKLLQDNPGLADFITKMVVAVAITGTLTTVIGIGGIAVLKYRAAMIAASLATAGMSLSMKVLLGSTGLGLLIAFLPEIIDLLDNGLTKGLVVGAIALYRLRAALMASSIAMWNLTLAVKSLVGSTGIGLLIVFLPEIIEALKKFFGDADEMSSQSAKNQNRRALQQKEDELAINKAKLDGLSRQEVDFIKREQVIRDKNFEALKITDKKTRKAAFENARILNDQLIKDKKEYSENLKKEDKKSSREVIDEKLLSMREENKLIQAVLDDREKEEIAFLKRRQEIQRLAREAEGEEDKNRRAAMLRNVKLLTQQLTKEQEAADQKEMELLATKSQRDSDREAKEIEASDRRIRQLKGENKIIKAQLQDVENAEIEFRQRKQALDEQELDAQEILDGKERDLALENIRLKNEQLLDETTKYHTDKNDLIAEQQELDNALQEELRQISKEQRDALTKEDLEELRNTLLTKSQMERKAAKKEILDKRKENKTSQEEEKKHGEALSAVSSFFRSDAVKAAHITSQELTNLKTDEVAEWRNIGKAAALVQIAISTEAGAMAAMASFAKLGPAGVFAGQAAAAVIIAAGLRSAQKVAGLQQGGFVPGSGIGDIVPAMLEPGELIVPRQNFDEVINAAVNQRSMEQETTTGGIGRQTDEDEEEKVLATIQVDYQSDEAADIISVQQNEQEYLGTSQKAFSR